MGPTQDREALLRSSDLNSIRSRKGIRPMAQFILVCDHTPEQCAQLNQELQSLGTPVIYKGKDFFCSCPHGLHGGWVVVEAETAEGAVTSLGPLNRAHTKVYQVETVRF
jgi:hypothetical protein